MIYESGPWKNSLLKDAALLDRWAAKPKCTERRSWLIEQKIFLAAYSIRKLHDAKKLSSSFDSKTLRCKVFSAHPDRTINSRYNHRFDEFYDMSKPVVASVRIRDILNTIIHSLVFSEVIRRDETVWGFFITSDSRKSKLWLLKLPAFTKVMRSVGQDYPSSSIWQGDGRGGTSEEWRGNGKPPLHLAQRFHK